MDFYCNQVGPPKECPDCNGVGRKPPCLYFCTRCNGTGKVVKLILAYPESYNTAMQPMGRMTYAGEIERPWVG